MIRLFKRYVADYRRTEAIMDRLAAPLEHLPGGYERWVDTSMHWLLDEFGREPLERPIVIPTELLGSAFNGGEAATRSLFEVICRRLDVPVDGTELRIGRLSPIVRPPASSSRAARLRSRAVTRSADGSVKTVAASSRSRRSFWMTQFGRCQCSRTRWATSC
jgi:hypothetical protein